MFQVESLSGPWRRVERRATNGQVLDYVVVGACTHCGRGVDRDFPLEYQLIDGTLLCLACAQASTAPAPTSLTPSATRTGTKGD